MSKQLRIWFFVLLGTLLTSTSLLAEGVITMTTSKAVEETIKLRIEANGNVTIEGVKETPQTGDWKTVYTLTSQTITIRGDVTILDCYDNQLTSLDVSGCTALTNLDCRVNQLTSLDVSKNTALTELDCSYNQLTSLDVSGCAALTTLSCYYNQLTSLDVSGCTALTTLYCRKNQLTSLDVSKNTALTELGCSYNQLTSLDVSGCTALTTLYCEQNPLTSLDVSGCTALTTLDCRENQLTSLDVSGCTALTELACSYNQLTSLNVSGCAALTTLSCYDNQLTSLDVSSYTALTTLDCRGNQLTSLDVSGCAALTNLTCFGNQLTSINLSGCQSLKEFSSTGYALTSLDVSGCTALTTLYCEQNPLTSLDVSGCTALTTLDCWENQLTSLDVSSCTALTELDCSYNQLTSLDVSGCTALTKLDCRVNQLTSLDVSKNPALTQLDCGYNQLTSLDLSSCPSLTELDCEYNQLTSLDLSKCLNLRYVNCSANRIKGEAMNRLVASLPTCSGDYSGEYNGYSAHSSYPGGYFVAVSSFDNEWNNCSKENVASARAKNWTPLNKKNGFKYYSLELVPYEGVDLNQPVGHGVITMTTERAVGESITLLFKANGSVALEGVKEILLSDGSTTYQILPGQRITLRGDVTALSCGESELRSLNVSGCPSLTWLGCWDNQLTSLDVSQNSALNLLSCEDNQLTSLDVSKNSSLTALGCSDNQLTSLDVSQNSVLARLSCGDNQLTNLDVSQNLSLYELYCQSNRLTSLDLSHNSALRWLDCNDNQLTSLNLSHNSGLRELRCYYNQIKGAEMSKLVNGLPQKDRRYNSNFYVVVKDSIEGNVCLKSDVAIVADKGWTPLGYNKSTELWEYYGGRETDSFGVSLTHEGEGSVIATGADDLKAVPYGTKLTITATPAEGYELAALTANGLDILESKSYEVTGYTEIKATFTKKSFAVTFAKEGEGTITATGASNLNSVAYGTELTINATPAEGYELTALTANGTDILATKKVVVEGNLTVKATFAKKNFAVSLTKEGEGTITATGASNLNSVAYGTELTINATPAEGYELTALTSNGTDILATKKVVVEGNLIVKATFTKKSFAITLTKEGEGTIVATGASNLNSVAYGTELTINATPAEGYELTALTANGTDILASKMVVVTDNITVKATFTQQTFAVTLTSNEHGEITIVEPVDLKAVPYGTTLTVKATGKNAQCVLTELTANGKDILATKSFVVTDVTEVKATFVDHTGVETTITQYVKLYPNPATDYVIVEGVAPASEVTLHSMTGERLYAGRADDRGTLQIDLTPYADGVYLVCVAGETYRVVVRH